MRPDVAAPAPATARMAAWASNPAPLPGRRFFAKTPRLALALREVLALRDAAMGAKVALLPLLEPFLEDRYDLVWRSDLDIWRPRLFFFRASQRLALEFRHNSLVVAMRTEGPDTHSFAYHAGQVTPEPECQHLLGEAERLHALAAAQGLRKITRFRFVTNNMRVFDSLATTAKLRLLADSVPDFRFHTLDIHPQRALVDPRAFPLGALFATAELLPRDAGPERAPEHIIHSTLYFQGGMRKNLRKGLDRLFERERATPRRPDAPFTLAISLDFEKRAWVEQAEAVARVLALLLAHHPRVELMVNGMTAPALEPDRDDFADIAERERQAIAGMLAGLPAPVPVRHLHGRTILQKSVALAGASYFLGPIGSASLVPLTLGLPGLVFGSADALKAAAWMIEPRDGLKIFPAAHVRYVEEALGARSYRWLKGWGARSYSIPPEAFVAHVADDLTRRGLLPAKAITA